MSNPFLDQYITHNIYTQRLGSHNANQFDEFIKRADRIIRDILSTAGDTIESKKTLNAIIKQLGEELAPVYGDYSRLLISNLEELAETETPWNVNALGRGVDANIKAPSTEQVIASAFSRPMAYGNTSLLISELMKNFTALETRKVQNAIRQGWYESQTVSQMVQTIRGTRANKFKDGILATTTRNAQTIARTATNHIANQTRQSVLESNDRLLVGVEWVSTLDSRTSSVCRIRDGQVYPVKKGPRPPAHPSCFTGDTSVTTCSDISNVYKRSYKGAIIDIATKSGRSISVTPNHPILTGRGWVKAGDINCTDQLACIKDKTLIVKHYKNSVKSTFSDLFSSLNVSVNPLSITDCPTAPEDFHGDVTDSKVGIINFDLLPWGDFVKSLRKDAKNISFVTGKTVNFTFLRDSSFNPLFKGCLSSLGGLVGVGGKCRDLLRSASVHSGLLLLRPISKRSVFGLENSYNRLRSTFKPDMLRDAVCTNTGFVSSVYGFKFIGSKLNFFRVEVSNAIGFKNSKDRLFTTAERLPDCFHGHVVDGAELDDVLDISVRKFDGHVYNLENKDNWYLANGIIAHNCRSTTSPKVKPEFSLFSGQETRASVGATGGKTTQATNYYSWLKTQSASFQDEVLGKTKGQIFRNAGLDTDEFRKLVSNNFDQPLTIAQIRAKEPAIWERLKL